MSDAPFQTLVTLQAGALAGLGGWFLLDGLRRRDGVLGLLAACMAAAATCAAAEATLLRGPVWLWATLEAGAYLLLLQAFQRSYPQRLPRHLPIGLGAALLPVVLLEGLGWRTLPALLLTHLGLLGASFMAAWALWILVQLRETDECATPWVLPAITLGFTLLVAHTTALHWVGPVPGLKPLALLLLAMALGGSHLKDHGSHLHARADHLEQEVQAWRSLLRGPTWRTGEPSDLMAERFGTRWATRLSETMLSMDGAPYRIHRIPLADGAQVGWAEPMTAVAEAEPFLKGWSIGLGMEEGDACDEVMDWLESWGAVVFPIGTVPPREGPYPNLLIWAREPSILSVWRELDLARRRCRWVQIGGAELEGPHGRLEREFTERELRELLRSLTSPMARAGSLRV